MLYLKTISTGTCCTDQRNLTSILLLRILLQGVDSEQAEIPLITLAGIPGSDWALRGTLVEGGTSKPLKLLQVQF